MKKYLLGFLAIIILVLEIILWQNTYFEKVIRSIVFLPNRQLASLTAIVQSPFYYTFKDNGALEEAGIMDDSSSPYFWLNSGGRFLLKDGIGKTVQGELWKFNKWRLAYSISNPVDTDNGYHPQNILRLVTRSKWRNFSQEIYFKITKLNISASPNRNASNGVLVFNRYQDGNNVYYIGIRVDGAVVIKKKMNGTYYTLAYKQFYNASVPYDHDTNPNLIPSQKWIGLKSEIKTNPDNTVSLKLFIDKDKTGVWVLVTEAIDDGKTYGGAAIVNEGYAGIRTDFMDVEFDDYKIMSI
ncbi:MAG: hypothetical protein Q8L47_00270 [bacterium]|nr:hypothetical protein [bacterium]